MPYELSTTRFFAAAHALRLYDGTVEPTHGHNWRVKVTVTSPGLDAIGVVMDFHDLEPRVDRIISLFHNRHLNELEPFARLNPSTENIAWLIATTLELPDGVVLQSVEVWETDTNSARYVL